MRLCRNNVLIFSVLFLMLSKVVQAATLADADALYRQKKWIPAAKAYEAFASGRSGGADCWRARHAQGRQGEGVRGGVRVILTPFAKHMPRSKTGFLSHKV